VGSRAADRPPQQEPNGARTRRKRVANGQEEAAGPYGQRRVIKIIDIELNLAARADLDFEIRVELQRGRLPLRGIRAEIRSAERKSRAAGCMIRCLEISVRRAGCNVASRREC